MSILRLRLYHYWRSSSSWRVRWALELKGLPYEAVPINLLTDEPESPEHRGRNPLGYVPVLELLNEEAESPFRFLAESVAIIEFLDEEIPTPALLPSSRHARARSRQLAEMINAGTQPLQNPNVAAFHSADPEEQKRWNQHWIRNGLKAYEVLAQDTAGLYSVGDEITLADLYLIPQCYNAARFEVQTAEFPLLDRIVQNAQRTEPCQRSAPDRYKL